MELISELQNYFTIDEQLKINEKLQKLDLDNVESFQQVTQEDNKIKFEIGYIFRDSLIDITYKDNTFDTTIVKIQDIKTIQTSENEKSYRAFFYISEKLFIYYIASSNNKIPKLKKFTKKVESIYQGVSL